MWQRVRWLVLLAVLVGLVLAVRSSVSRVGQVRVAGEVCGASESGRFEEALRLSNDLPQRPIDGSDDSLLQALECRCLALVGLERGDDCSNLLADLAEKEELATWVPSEILAAAAIDRLEERGSLDRAVTMARGAIDRYPRSPLFHSREFRARSQAIAQQSGAAGPSAEASAALLLEFEQRLSDLGERSADLPLLLASQYSNRSEWDEALRVLGDRPPSDPSLVDEWFMLRTASIGGKGDPGALNRAFDEWERVEGPSARLDSIRALQFDKSQLHPTYAVALRSLIEAVAREDDVNDEDLEFATRRRLIRVLAAGGFLDRSLAVYDETLDKYGPMETLSREELARIAAGDADLSLEVASAGGEPGFLVFEGLDPDDELRVSPADWSDPRAQFEDLGRQRVLRRSDTKRPVWWTALDSDQQVVGEGSIWLEAGATKTHVVSRQPPQQRPGWNVAPAVAGDGHTRVLVLILDSADWRILRFLQSADRVPAFDGLTSLGLSGSLWSQPAYTAAALQALTRPAEGTFGVLHLFHQLGEEVEGLNFIGRNPVAGLNALLPQTPTLFETIGSGPLQAINLLRSTGALRAGRNASIAGPNGSESQLSGYQGSRPLETTERQTVPLLAEELAGDLGVSKPLFEEAAADFDTIEAVLEAGEIELIAARVASLDLMTHANFAALNSQGRDNVVPRLLVFYQYLDYRMARLTEHLDSDDTFILMSDHGAKSSLEHDPLAVFVMVGPNVETGSFDATPALGGVSRLVAGILGIQTEWPATELADLVAKHQGGP